MTRGDNEQTRRLRQICLALPEVTERLSHGEPTWFVRDKKTVATLADRHHDDRLACWLAAPPGAQRSLVAAEPSRYFVPPYVGGRGWIGVYLDLEERGEGQVDWASVEDHVEAAYRVVAPKKLVAVLDELLADKH